MRKGLVLLIMLVTVLSVHGVCRNYQVEDGLSNNSVWCLHQDRYGFMWIGTKNGLNRYDGHTFKVYQKRSASSHSIGNNFIHCILDVNEVNMLIGTSNGLYLYSRVNDNFSPVTLSRNKKKIVVNDILKDNNGNLWVATHGCGLFMLNKGLKVIGHFAKGGKKGDISSDYIWKLGIDSNNNLWLGTAGEGFSMYNSHLQKFVNHKKLGITSLLGQSIYGIYGDKDGSIWLGSSSAGLINYNPSNNTYKFYVKDIPNIKVILPYRGNQLLLGTERGLFLQNKGTGKTVPMSGIADDYRDNYNAVFDVVQDKNGGIWTGTYFCGLNYLKRNTKTAIRSVKVDGSSSVKAVVSSITVGPDGNIYLATHNNSTIYCYNPKTNYVKPAIHLGNANVLDMKFIGNKLLVGISGNGIDVLAYPKFNKVGHIHHNLIEGPSIFTLESGAFILALEEGGAIYCPSEREELRLTKLNKVLINGVAQDKRGTIWFSSYSNGIFAWTNDRKWKNYQSLRYNGGDMSLHNLTCMTLANDKMIFGSDEAGLIVVDPKSMTVDRIYNAKSGLFSNSVYSMTKDGFGRIWACTKDNIVCISPSNNGLIFMGRQGKTSISNVHCSNAARNGLLYFGGTYGFYAINPRFVKSEKNKSSIQLTGLQLNAQDVTIEQDNSPITESIEFCKTIHLKSNENSFSLSFALLDFSNPDEDLYRTRLDGYDNAWVYSQRPLAEYMNLPPGKYVFHVSGSNGNGAWSEEKTIEIIIAPPFWKSWWMISFYIIAICGLIYFAVWYYNRYLRKQHEARQREFQISQERELYQQKINFFTNIAHEIRTPLTLISTPLETIMKKKDTPKDIVHNLDIIQRNTNRLLLLVGQLLDFRKVENNMYQINIRYQRVQSIIEKVYEQYALEAEANHIDFTLSMPKEEVLGYIDAEAVYKIVSNLLSNALKFTKSVIVVKLTVEKGIGCISVVDDGVGIKPMYQKDVFEPFFQVSEAHKGNKGTGLGLSLSRSLALKMKGNLYIDGSYTKGAKFVMEIPIMDTGKRFEHPENHTLESIKEPDNIALSPAKAQPSLIVVEDNNELSQFIAETLSENYTVYTATDGQDALDKIMSNDIDIIISDVMMPVMDGIELCLRLKNSKEYSHLPIILLSAKTDVETKIKGLKGGADVYLDKPFSIEQLSAQIKGILDKRADFQRKLLSNPLQFYKKKDVASDDNVKFVESLNQVILNRMSDRDFNVDMLVKEFATNRSDFQKKVKKITGLTPNEYIRLVRLNKSVELLSSGRYKINEVCTIIGFNSPSYFSKCFYAQFGKLPKDFIQ